MSDRLKGRAAGNAGGRAEPGTGTVGRPSAAVQAGLATILAQRERALASVARQLGSREAARDVVQIALLKAIEGIESVRRHESIVAWFRRILSNVSTDYQRHGAAYHRALEKMAAHGGDTMAMSLADSRCGCLDEVLPTLRPAYAAMLRRVDLEDRSLGDVARQDGLTINNARVRLHRARRALRRRWTEVCGGPPLERCRPCSCERRAGGQAA